MLFYFFGENYSHFSHRVSLVWLDFSVVLRHYRSWLFRFSLWDRASSGSHWSTQRKTKKWANDDEKDILSTFTIAMSPWNCFMTLTLDSGDTNHSACSWQNVFFMQKTKPLCVFSVNVAIFGLRVVPKTKHLYEMCGIPPQSGAGLWFMTMKFNIEKINMKLKHRNGRVWETKVECANHHHQESIWQSTHIPKGMHIWEPQTHTTRFLTENQLNMNSN